MPHACGKCDLAGLSGHTHIAGVPKSDGRQFLFPRWTNRVVPIGLGVLLGLSVICGAAFAYYGTDSNLAVGYSPVQPVDYSHKLHAGDLGMDCRYCHSTVERASFAAVPATQVCMNCHSKVRTDSSKILPVRESYSRDEPIAWVHIHKLPDFVYFDHSAHLAAGVGCSTCHGRVDQMARVEQVEPLSMGWCLDCHRNPTPNLRDPAEVTKMDWTPHDVSSSRAGAIAGTSGADALHLVHGRVPSPPTHCSGCHR